MTRQRIIISPGALALATAALAVGAAVSLLRPVVILLGIVAVLNVALAALAEHDARSWYNLWRAGPDGR